MQVAESEHYLPQPLSSSQHAPRYVRLSKLGEGVYGVVYKACNTTTGEHVALKRMVPIAEEDGIPGSTIREISFLQNLHHPNIVQLMDVVFAIPKLSLIFELCEMDLSQYLHKLPDRRLRAERVSTYMRQFLAGLAFIHHKRIVHRDLKPHNLLLSGENHEQLKVADFGLARIIGIPVKKYRHDAVTLWYRSPDLLLGSVVYGPELDMWSAGCILAEMVTGKVLFNGKNDGDQLRRMFKLLGYPTSHIYYMKRLQEGSSHRTHTFAQYCTFPSIVKYPNFMNAWKKGYLTVPGEGNMNMVPDSPQQQQQPAAPYLTWAEWLHQFDVEKVIGVEGIDLLRRMLMLEPSRRITAVEALRHPFFHHEKMRKKISSTWADMSCSSSDNEDEKKPSAPLTKRPLGSPVGGHRRSMPTVVTAEQEGPHEPSSTTASVPQFHTTNPSHEQVPPQQPTIAVAGITVSTAEDRHAPVAPIATEVGNTNNSNVIGGLQPPSSPMRTRSPRAVGQQQQSAFAAVVPMHNSEIDPPPPPLQQTQQQQQVPRALGHHLQRDVVMAFSAEQTSPSTSFGHQPSPATATSESRSLPLIAEAVLGAADPTTPLLSNGQLPLYRRAASATTSKPGNSGGRRVEASPSRHHEVTPPDQSACPREDNPSKVVSHVEEEEEDDDGNLDSEAAHSMDEEHRESAAHHHHQPGQRRTPKEGMPIVFQGVVFGNSAPVVPSIADTPLAAAAGASRSRTTTARSTSSSTSQKVSTGTTTTTATSGNGTVQYPPVASPASSQGIPINNDASCHNLSSFTRNGAGVSEENARRGDSDEDNSQRSTGKEDCLNTPKSSASVLAGVSGGSQTHDNRKAQSASVLNATPQLTMPSSQRVFVHVQGTTVGGEGGAEMVQDDSRPFPAMRGKLWD